MLNQTICGSDMHDNDCLHFCVEFSFATCEKSNPNAAELIIRVINENKYRLRFSGGDAARKHAVY